MRITEWNEELGAHVRRVVGYWPCCPCGWNGRVWPSVGAGRAELREHRATEHKQPRGRLS